MYDTPFTKVLPKIYELDLTPRKSKVEKRKNLRRMHAKIKKSVENTWTLNSRDVDNLYGTRMSGSSHDKQRSNLFFELKSKAVERSGKCNYISARSSKFYHK